MSFLEEDRKVDYARHVQRSTMVETIEQVFAFCLDTIDEEKLRHPAITVQPVMTYDQEDDGSTQHQVRFEVSISGPT